MFSQYNIVSKMIKVQQPVLFSNIKENKNPHLELFLCVSVSVDVVIPLEPKSHCCNQKVVVCRYIGTTHHSHIPP
jgi:hypothetical protein